MVSTTHTKAPLSGLVVVVVAVVAIAASLFFLLRTPHEKAEQAATELSEALGMKAGEEVARLIGHSGRVAVIEMDIKASQAPTAVATTEMFRQTLKKHDITVARTKKMPGSVSSLVMGGGSISWDDYVALVTGSPVVDAVITFARLPASSDDDLHQFQMNHPPLVMVDIFGLMNEPALSALVDQRAVAMAFVPYSSVEIEQRTHEPNLFERYYRILRSSSK